MARANQKTIHLFNCDNLCNLSEAESLLKAVEKKASFKISKIVKHPFKGGQITDEAEKTIPNLKAMDYAVFVVHAHECSLSFNEDSGYGKIYKALKIRAGLDENVLVVIGGDDNYKDDEEKEQCFISRWARETAIARQFRAELLDGRKSFIFSWNKNHRPIHEEALLHYFDPNKKGKKFQYQPKPKPVPRIEEPKITPPPATKMDEEKGPESSLQESADEEETTDSSVDEQDGEHGPADESEEYEIQVSSEDFEVSSTCSSDACAVILKTYLRYGKISFESKDVLTWDGSWRPPVNVEEKLKAKWKSRRLMKLTMFADENHDVKRVVVKPVTVGDYCSIS